MLSQTIKHCLKVARNFVPNQSIFKSIKLPSTHRGTANREAFESPARSRDTGQARLRRYASNRKRRKWDAEVGPQEPLPQAKGIPVSETLHAKTDERVKPSSASEKLVKLDVNDQTMAVLIAGKRNEEIQRAATNHTCFVERTESKLPTTVALFF
jgi:hypothetical protein